LGGGGKGQGIGVAGYFAYIGILTGLGTIFLILFAKESKGMTDKARKSLYVPQKYRHLLIEDDADGEESDGYGGSTTKEGEIDVTNEDEKPQDQD
jgi:hypothetical protein